MLFGCFGESIKTVHIHVNRVMNHCPNVPHKYPEAAHYSIEIERIKWILTLGI
jgi:hypothetical protein